MIRKDSDYEKIGGCIFPVLGTDGKRRVLCNENTLFDAHGSKYAFCTKHYKMIREYALAKIRDQKRNNAKSKHHIRGKVLLSGDTRRR